MAVYRFRVFIEDDHEVYRDIDVLGKQRFADLHRLIIESFNFEHGQPAEYLNADQQWYEEDSVVKLDKNLSGDHQKIVDHITVPRQRFLCVTVSHNEVGLALELQKIFQEVSGLTYPLCSRKEGEPPYYTQPPPEPIVDTKGEEELPEIEDDMFDEDGPSEEEIERIQKEAEAAGRSGAFEAPKVNLNKLKKKPKKKEEDEGFGDFDMNDLM